MPTSTSTANDQGAAEPKSAKERILAEHSDMIYLLGPETMSSGAFAASFLATLEPIMDAMTTLAADENHYELTLKIAPTVERMVSSARKIVEQWSAAEARESIEAGQVRQ